MPLEIRLLGPVSAASDGSPVELGPKKQRAVLAMLALDAGRTVSTDRLARGLWGDSAPDTAPKMIQAYVSRLRKAIPGADTAIVTHGRGYELSVPPDSVDALQLDRLVTEATRASGNGVPDADAVALAREAVTLWRGPPLVDVEDEPFASTEIRRLEDLWLRAKEIAIDAELAAGRDEAALADLDPLVDRYPLRERLHAQRMLALYRSGRQADALAAYRSARETLVEEIGVEPGRDLQRLHEAILAQDPALERAAPAPVAEPADPSPGRVEPIEAAPDPAASTATRRRPHQLMFAAAAALLLGGVLIFVLTRGDDGKPLPGIAEDTVAVISGDGHHLGTHYDVGRGPSSLTAAGGYVWAANELDGTVTRIDPKTDDVLAIDVGGDPVKLASGQGSVWVADGTGRSVAQIGPEDARVLQRIDVGGGPRGLAVGAGSLWVGSTIDGEIARVDLAKGRVTQRIPVSSTPTDVAFGAGGVWVASETGGTVIRIDPDTGRVVDAVNVGNGPASIAIGDGAVWAANRQDGTISRIDPSTASVTATIPVGRGPVAIAAANGLVWTANGDDGTISRVDARAGRVTDAIEIGTTPSALLPVGRDIWATALPARDTHRGGTLRVRLRPPDLCRCADPIGYDGATWPLIPLVYDGLLAYRRTGGAAGSTLVGDLATGVPRPTDDGRTYSFRLRPGIRYSNGMSVRASDVRASLERLLSIHSRPPGTEPPPYFEALPGASACAKGPCDLSKAIDVDDRAGVVTFHLTHPDAELLQKLALPLAVVMPSGSPRRVVTGVPPPGTGPYRLTSFDGRRGARLVRNPHFRSWSAQARPDGFPDAMEVSFTPPDLTRDAAAIARGDSDFVALQPGDEGPHAADRIRGLLASRSGRLEPAPQLETDYMFMNVTIPPFDDVRVRRAVNLATDRRRVSELAGGPEIARPTCQILPPAMPGYRPFCPWTENPSPAGEWRAPDLGRAKRLIAASGTRGRHVTVWTPKEFRAQAGYFVGLMRRLGYPSSLRVLPSFPAYFPVVGNSRTRAQMGVYGWLADYVAPSNFINPTFTCAQLVPRSPLNANVSQFCDPQLDATVKRALTRPAADPSATASLWSAIDRRIVLEAPVVPLVNLGAASLVATKVGNVQQHPFWGTLLDQLWVR